MQAGRRRVEADISRYRFLGEEFVEARFIGDLMNEAAFFQRAEEIGFELGHDLLLSGADFRIGYC